MNSFLIDNDTLKKRGFVNRNVESSILTTTLERVQDTMLVPVIGTPFFKHLCKAVKDGTLTTDEETLLNEYIAPFLIASVDYRIGNHLTYELRSKTAGKSGDSYITPLDRSEIVALNDDLRKDVERYREQLIGHLKDNRTKFDTYDTFVCSHENVKPESGEKFVSIVF
jgi:hypothetical protein